jgi:hypothetical protein
MTPHTHALQAALSANLVKAGWFIACAIILSLAAVVGMGLLTWVTPKRMRAGVAVGIALYLIIVLARAGKF